MATHNDFNFTSRSDGGSQWNDPAWSNFMNSLNIGGRDSGGSGQVRSFSWSVRFNTYGRQTFDTAVDDSGDLSINGVYQFSLGGYNGQSSRTTPGNFAPGVYTVTATSVNSGGGPWGVALDWTGVVTPPGASITSFSGPDQNSLGGTPLYTTTLSWQTSNGASATITSSAGETWVIQSSQIGSGSLNITNLPQSVVGSSSPATRTYTLKVYNVSGQENKSASRSITISARNDNTPSNSWTTSWNMLEPSTTYVKFLGTLAGVDMPTRCVAGTDSAGGSSTFFAINAAGSESAATKTFSNGNGIYVKFTTLPFNKDISGQTGIYGKTNTKTVPITIGSQSFNISIQTRAPIIAEEFPTDFDVIDSQIPNPDIDVITSPSPLAYLVSSELVLDDVELSSTDNTLEIKADNPNLEVRIKPSGSSSYGNWKNIRQI